MVKRPLVRHPWLAHPNLVFWSIFIALNILLFLPLYLLDSETSSFLPGSARFSGGLKPALDQLFVWRSNLDPLRISVEFTLLVSLWVLVRRLRRPLLGHIIAGVYLLALCYYLYEAIMASIYHTDPVFYSHFFLARDGLPFLAKNVQTAGWVYAFALTALAAAVVALIALVRILLASAAQPALSMATRITIGALALLCLTALVRYQFYTARPEMVPSSLGYKLQQNIAASLQLYADVTGFDGETVRSAYDYTGRHLQKKPDIYFIFIESYGSVLYKRMHFRLPYATLLASVEDALGAGGWRTASALSESPTWGGGSWMAYTSLLFGLRIDNHPQYLSLLNKYQVEHYPDLGSYLQSQGYTYAWVTSLANELDERAWNRYIRFLGVDDWLRYSDLDYHGQHYSWGPAPPDQYTLNYTNALLQTATDQPLFYVTITQNSHYPWRPQPTLVEDWRALNQAPPPGAAPISAADDSSTVRQDYLQAISYQLRTIEDFILRNGDDDTLFFLIGDHQPPRVSRRVDGFDTPIHIISKNQALLDAFGEFGFTPGLWVQDLESDLHHEGFYSLFMHVLVGQYGAKRIALPAYLPQGVTPHLLP
jgi:phosphoglycerol transferase MdoB-like AlkP superfamily enzyme